MTTVSRQKKDALGALLWSDAAKTVPLMESVVGAIEIRTPAQLAWFAASVNNQTPNIGTGTADSPESMLYDEAVLKIMNNIDLNGKPWKPIGFDGVRYFRGHVDGDGDGDGRTNLISGLSVRPVTLADITSAPGLNNGHFGLFGIMKTRVSKPHLTFKNLRVQGDVAIPIEVANSITAAVKRTAGIVGSLDRTNISNCMFYGKVEATYQTTSEVAGIVSHANGVTITGCRSFAEVTLYSSSNISTIAGGVAGRMTSGTIMGCDFSGKITVKGSASSAGILAEGGSGVTIKASRNNGTIDAEGTDNAIGGILAQMKGGRVYACYNKGTLTCSDGRSRSEFGGIGGIVGAIADGPGSEVRACYNRGEVIPSANQRNYAGNIVGNYYFNRLTESNFSYSQVSDNYYVRNALVSDQLSKLELNSVMRFSPTNWPKPEGLWGLGNGSADNTYWHVDSQTSYGTEDWSYPQLYWEIIR